MDLPDEIYFRARSQFTESVNTLGTVIEKHKRTDGQIDKKEMALACFRVANKKGHLIGLYNYGLALADHNILDEAEQLLLKYIRLAPDDCDGYSGVAIVYQKQQKFSLCREYRIKALKLGEYDLLHSVIWGLNDAVIANELVNLIYHALKGGATNVKAETINKLGYIYSSGQYGVVQDHDKASEMWEISVGMGYKTSFYNLAENYQSGVGLTNLRNKFGPENFWTVRMKAAFDLYTQGASLGCKNCQRELGKAYEHGLLLLTKDINVAMEWYTKASSEPNADACSCLKIVHHLKKTKGHKFKEDNEAIYYDSAVTNQQSDLALRCIKNYSRFCNEDQPKELSIPFNVLDHWRFVFEYEIPKLKQKILELELRPPNVGGSLYEEAQKDFIEKK